MWWVHIKDKTLLDKKYRYLIYKYFSNKQKSATLILKSFWVSDSHLLNSKKLEDDVNDFFFFKIYGYKWQNIVGQFKKYQKLNWIYFQVTVSLEFVW